MHIDTQQSIRFLKLIDANARAFTFQTFREKGGTMSSIEPKVIHSNSLSDLRREHDVGAGVYVTINETDGHGRKTENIKRIRAIFQEDDDGYSGTFPIAPSIIVETSPQHFHRYWLVADEWPAGEKGRAEFATVMARMIETYGSDPNAKDVARVLRLPGFLHRKAEPHMVRIVEASGKRYTRAELLAAFPPVVRETKESKPRTDWKPSDDDDERIREALDYVDPDPREVWRNIGMALKEHLGESGRALWDCWSRRATDKYDDREQEKAWRSFHRHDIKIGTLFHYAQQSGWKSERYKGASSAGGQSKAGEGKAGAEQPTPKRKVVLVRADALTPESISWAWKDRFAFGKMAMIAGDPGLGKSTILVEIAALHSRGSDFPCGEGKAIRCKTLFLTAEDGLRDTLVPRLIAAEADLAKIIFLTGTQVGRDEATAMFDITNDVAALRQVFTDDPDIKILVIDPLTAYLGAGTKAKENTDVRRVLTPLIKLAEEFGVALLANNHLNKSGGKALYRVLDSIAFVALGRTIHVVAADTEIPDNRKFICDKSNIGSKPRGLTYILQKCWIKGEQGEEIETSRISWGTKHIDETADEALGDTEATTSTGEAEAFLEDVLADGRVAIHDVEAEARAAGLLGDRQQISLSKPFRSARNNLGVISSRDGFGPGAVYYWSLPKRDSMLATMVATSKSRASMGSEGKHGENGQDEDDQDSNPSLHTCPQTPCLPSLDQGKHDGNGHSPSRPDLVVPDFLDRRCVQCAGRSDGTERLVMIDGQAAWLHPECERFHRRMTFGGGTATTGVARSSL